MPVKSKKRCPRGKHMNLSTKRCVKKCSKNKQRIKNRCVKKCPLGKRRSRITFRCHKISRSQKKHKVKKDLVDLEDEILSASYNITLVLGAEFEQKEDDTRVNKIAILNNVSTMDAKAFANTLIPFVFQGEGEVNEAHWDKSNINDIYNLRLIIKVYFDQPVSEQFIKDKLNRESLEDGVYEGGFPWVGELNGVEYRIDYRDRKGDKIHVISNRD